MADKIFAEGIYFNEKNEKQPDFVLANMSIKPPEFIAWLSEQKQNEKGYVKLVAKRSKAGKAYVEVDTWEPKKQDNISDDFFEKL